MDANSKGGQGAHNTQHATTAVRSTTAVSQWRDGLGGVQVGCAPLAAQPRQAGRHSSARPCKGRPPHPPPHHPPRTLTLADEARRRAAPASYGSAQQPASALHDPQHHHRPPSPGRVAFGSSSSPAPPALPRATSSGKGGVGASGASSRPVSYFRPASGGASPQASSTSPGYASNHLRRSPSPATHRASGGVPPPTQQHASSPTGVTTPRSASATPHRPASSTFNKCEWVMAAGRRDSAAHGAAGTGRHCCNVLTCMPMSCHAQQTCVKNQPTAPRAPAGLPALTHSRPLLQSPLASARVPAAGSTGSSSANNSKPLFAAYGLQLRGGSSNAPGAVTSPGSRPSQTSASPYRARPASGTPAAATTANGGAAATTVAGPRPHTSSAPHRPGGALAVAGQNALQFMLLIGAPCRIMTLEGPSHHIAGACDVLGPRALLLGLSTHIARLTRTVTPPNPRFRSAAGENWFGSTKLTVTLPGASMLEVRSVVGRLPPDLCPLSFRTDIACLCTMHVRTQTTHTRSPTTSMWH